MRVRLGAVLSVLIAWMASAAGAQAGGVSQLVSPQPAATLDVDVPLASVIEPITENHLYVIRDLPPARVLVYSLNADLSLTRQNPIDLPDEVAPSALWWDLDGNLHIETRQKRSFVFCPGCGSLSEGPQRVAAIGFLGGVAQGYTARLLTDYGNAASGSVWFGPLFDEQLALGDGEHPGAIDYGGYGGVRDKLIVGGFATVDGFRDRLILISDTDPPTEVGAAGGPAAAQQLAGVAISPLNLSPSASGAAQLPMFVSSPGTGINMGNVYSSVDWSSTSTPTWRPISPTPTGIPTALDAGCHVLLANDYANDRIDVYRMLMPSGAECEEGIDLERITAESKRKAFAVGAVLKPYMNATGKVGVSVGLPNHKERVEASARLKLRAGHITTVKVKFSRSASATIGAAVADGHKLEGKAVIRVADAGGHRVTVTQPLTVRPG